MCVNLPNYNLECAVDNIIAFPCASVMERISDGVCKFMKDSNDKGRHFVSGKDVARIVCRELIAGADKIQTAISNFEKETDFKYN